MIRLLLVVLCAIVAAQADEAVDTTPEFDDGDGSMLSFARCLLHARKLDCAERRASTALRKLRDEENAVETSRSGSMADLEKQLADAAADVFGLEGKASETEGRAIVDTPYEKNCTLRISGLPELRLPLCHDELDPPEELVDQPPFVVDLVQIQDSEEVPEVISESTLTSLLRYWREAKNGDLVIAAPSLPDPWFLAAPKTPPAPFPSFAKYATSLPPRPLFDHELIAAPMDDVPRPLSQILVPELEDEILLNLTDLQRLDATVGEIAPPVPSLQ